MGSTSAVPAPLAAPPVGVPLAVVEEFDFNVCPKLPTAQICDLAALRKDLGMLVNRRIRPREALENTSGRATSGSDLLGDRVDFGVDSFRHALAGRGS
ncbi:MULTISPECIES: hypothetical protein [unclassified Streptomyces]|uniref:hypothetical protein n=1 Tax=unclassified Streptomyces TaxID=2593676 RepID=UPI0033BBA702